ncbi:EF-P 5-aminopentanol modification-associated protein YfmF [Hazenella coriacea]|uniref:Putative Zn-dependent peptidase n=1 Tax=Hazenella coriacea TaxID=1179467 RepID=A0A4R3L1V4_9BACL|nr:pitrilysin family protein [Hazenella coriacea]TCS92576.1 putative Zn-dependent peptidase [Hazenella coriacea]
MTYAQFDTVSIGNIRVHVCASEKFKTTTLVANIQQELKKDLVTRTALLPQILQRGTISYPTTIDFKRYLDHLYGTIFYGDLFKRGERHIIQLGMEVANEQYLKETKSLLAEAIRFFSEVLSKPVTENRGFKSSYVESEKKVLKQRIESLQDDKIRYAAQRMTEEMCQGEPYAIFNHGQLEDIPVIDGENLYTYYQDVIRTCPIDFYCVGNVTTDEVVQLLQQHLVLDLSGERKKISVATVQHPVQKVKVVEDQLDVKQGKLNLGCRTQISIQDEDYPALLMYNGVLGGFPHSKLFMNVREKASLAYYCSSRIESHKGLLNIQSGIEIANYKQAVEIIQQQLEAMRQGEINDKEVAQTKATVSNQYREVQDRSYELINYHYHHVLSGKDRPLEQLLEEISSVSKQDIQRVAQKVELDTIYFLRDQGGTSHA